MPENFPWTYRARPSPDDGIGYGETAIAEAARPTLGETGFTLMAPPRRLRPPVR